MNPMFNSGPASYPPTQAPATPQVVMPQMVFPQIQPQQQAPIVQLSTKGREAAMQYKLPPNSRVAIFDDDEEVFYYKETDASGNVVNFTPYSYTEIHDPPAPEYLTVQEFRSTMDEFAKKIREEINDGRSIRTQNSGKQANWNAPKSANDGQGNSK